MAPIPKSIGRYEIVGLVGRGGMGVLYRAHDPMLERDVAVKMMHVDFTLDPSARARFEREAKAVARLQHRNVVTLHELGEVEGTPYIVMEFLGGKDLDAILRGDKPLTLGEKLDIVAQVCEGLGYAHDQGIVHRDIKPGNVRVLEDGTVKILDFGIARFATTTVTQSGSIMGTPSYMSPEQIMGKAVDGRSDLFSAGVLLYELLSGRKPFSGDSPTAVAYQIMHTEPTPVRLQVPELPEALNEIASRALQKDADERYSRAAEMAADLQMVRLVLDPPLQSLETGRITGSSPLTLGKLHATTMRPRTGEHPTAALETPMRATPEDQAAAAAGRTGAAKGGRGVMFAVAGVVLVLAAIVGYAVMGSRGDDTDPSSGAAVTQTGAGATGGGAQTGAAAGGGGATGTGGPAVAGSGPVQITSIPPGARILLNGADTGQVTPATVAVTLPAALQLSIKGYEAQAVNLTQSDVTAGRKDVRLSREAMAVKLAVTGSYPFELVQGSRVISASATSHAVTIQPGGADVIARSPEMLLRSPVAIDFRRPQLSLTIPEPGLLSIFARNETCPLFVDDVEVGFSPIVSKRIASGTHSVMLKCPGGKEERKPGAVPPGGSARVEFRD